MNFYLNFNRCKENLDGPKFLKEEIILRNLRFKSKEKPVCQVNLGIFDLSSRRKHDDLIIENKIKVSVGEIVFQTFSQTGKDDDFRDEQGVISKLNNLYLHTVFFLFCILMNYKNGLKFLRKVTAYFKFEVIKFLVEILLVIILLIFYYLSIN